MRRRRRSWAVLGFSLLATAPELGGCGPAAEPRFGVVYRLVDAAIRDRAVVHPPILATRDDTTFGSQVSAVARIPTATIGNDTRSVMATYPIAWGGLQELHFDAVGSVRTVLSLGAFAAAGGRVAVVSHAKLGNSLSWEELPATIVPVSGAHAEVLLQAGMAYAGSELVLSTQVYPALADKDTSVEVPPLRLPRGARLELSLGVMDAAREQGSVRFSVEACSSAGCSERFAATLDPLTPEAAGWRDERIDLLDLGDQEVSLRFLTRHIGEGSFSLPVWGDPQIVAPIDSPGRAPPSIVMLSIDTLAITSTPMATSAARRPSCARTWRPRGWCSKTCSPRPPPPARLT